MSEDKSEVGLRTGVGKPIPTEHTLAADGDVVPVRGDQFEEESEVVSLDVGMAELFAFFVHDADVHLSRMEVNSAVVFGGGCIILHISSEMGTGWCLFYFS